MSVLELEDTKTLRSLDPRRPKALENVTYNLLNAAGTENKAVTKAAANGWPTGYWGYVACCLMEGNDNGWELPHDPAPEPHPCSCNS